MKIKHLIIVMFAAAALSSCLGDGTSNHTPEIYLAKPYVIGGDTLSLWVTDDGLLMDTVNVGDTVQFLVAMNAYYNNLVQFRLKKSVEGVTEIILPPKDSLDLVFNSQSDYKNGVFKMDKGIAEIYFSFRYVAVKASKEIKLEMTVESDAKFDNGMLLGNASNVKSVVIKTPIIEKENTDDAN